MGPSHYPNSCNTLLTLSENLADNAFVKKYSTISLYLTKLFVTYSFAIASSFTYSAISAKTFLTVQQPPHSSLLIQLLSNYCFPSFYSFINRLYSPVYCKTISQPADSTAAGVRLSLFRLCSCYLLQYSGGVFEL